NAANAGGNAYVMSQSSGLYQVSAALGLTPIGTPGLTYANSFGLAGAPNGHLLAAVDQGIVDINPSNGSSTLITTTRPDGVSVSPNGKTVYGAVGGAVVGYDIATHAVVFNSGSISGAPDGTGVISGGAFNGRIIVNMNDGTVVLIDPANPDNSTNR